MFLLKRLRSYAGFKLRGSGSQNYQHPLAAKLYVGSPTVLEVQERARRSSYHSVTVSNLVELGVNRRLGGQKRPEFLFVRHAFKRQFVRPISS